MEDVFSISGPLFHTASEQVSFSAVIINDGRRGSNLTGQLPRKGADILGYWLFAVRVTFRELLGILCVQSVAQ